MSEGIASYSLARTNCHIKGSHMTVLATFFITVRQPEQLCGRWQLVYWVVGKGHTLPEVCGHAHIHSKHKNRTKITATLIILTWGSHAYMQPFNLYTQSYLCCLLLACEHRPYRQKGFEGVHLNPPFGLKSTTLNPTICKWPTSFAAIENHAQYCCRNKFVCNYTTCLFMEDQWMNAYHVHKHLRNCDERMHINICLNKSLFQALEWFTTNNEVATEQAGVKSSFWKCMEAYHAWVCRHLAVV